MTAVFNSLRSSECVVNDFVIVREFDAIGDSANGSEKLRRRIPKIQIILTARFLLRIMPVETGEESAPLPHEAHHVAGCSAPLAFLKLEAYVGKFA